VRAVAPLPGVAAAQQQKVPPAGRTGVTMQPVSKGSGTMQAQRKFPWGFVLIVVAIIAALVAWYLWQADKATPVASPPPVAAPAAEAEPAGPQYPVPVEVEDVERNLRPLPALDDSDQYFKLELSGLFGNDFAGLFVNTALIERLVATIDSLPRQQVAARIRPVSELPDQIAVAGQDGSGEFMLLNDNYHRYDAIVAQIAAANLNEVHDLYRRYYPLFQKAYEGLGYPDRYFNDRLVEVIDHLLATPDVQEPLLLVRPHVLFQFAEPQLEALSSGQKLLIRVGPAHRATIKASLRALRALLVPAER
jgi:Protein of unknown function (DUF3014)